MKTEISVSNAIFVGSKDEDSTREIIDDFKNAKEIRILTYSLPQEDTDDGKQKKWKIKKLYDCSKRARIHIIFPLIGSKFAKQEDNENENYNYNKYTISSLKESINNILDLIDFSMFQIKPYIGVCFKNHAKIIGTENKAYVGSANYSEGSQFNYEAGFIINDKTIVKKIYDDFFNKVQCVELKGDEADELRVVFLSFVDVIENMIGELNSYKEYGYLHEVNYRKEMGYLVKQMGELHEKLINSPIKIESLTKFINSTYAFMIDEKTFDFLDTDIYSEDELTEVNECIYRRYLGLMQDIPDHDEYFIYPWERNLPEEEIEGRLYVPLNEMPYENVLSEMENAWRYLTDKSNNAIEFSELNKTMDTIETIKIEAVDLLNNIENLIVESFKQDVINKGNDDNYHK